MGAAVDEAALAACVRETLDTFLGDHPGLEHAAVAVTGSAGCTLLDVDGFLFQLHLEGGIDEPNDEADRAILKANASPELLKALKAAVNALAMCVPTVGYAADCHHNAMTLGRATIAKAEGRL